MQWDKSQFFEALEARKGADVAAVAMNLLDWAVGRNLRISWGKGTKDGSFAPMIDHNGRMDWTISVWTYGTVEIQFKQLSVADDPSGAHPFSSESSRMELLNKLNAIPGIAIPQSAIAKRPTLPLDVFVDSDRRTEFMQVLDWLVDRLTLTKPPS